MPLGAGPAEADGLAAADPLGPGDAAGAAPPRPVIFVASPGAIRDSSTSNRSTAKRSGAVGSAADRLGFGEPVEPEDASGEGELEGDADDGGPDDGRFEDDGPAEAASPVALTV